MTDLRKAAEMALKALELVYKYTDSLTCYASTLSEHPPNAIDPLVCESIEALRQALAQDEQGKKKSNGCKRKLASGQWWHHCGDTDFGSMPALCTECGGDLKLEQA